MKKNTVKLFVLALALGFGFAANAQEVKKKRVAQTNVAELNRLAERYRLQDAANQKLVAELAEKNNWPLEIRNEKGGYMRLTNVMDGKPVYTSTFNEETAITSRVDKLHPNGGSGLDLTGYFYDNEFEDERVTIGVWDGQYPKVTHPEFVGRFSSMDGAANNPQDHPTHVLGTLIAEGIDPQARGMAYEGFGKVANFANDFSEMATNSASLVLSNHSYGIPTTDSSVTGVYFGGFAKKVDDIAFNAPYYQPVIAAGNLADGTYDNLADRGLAKNGITVAAIYKLDWVNQTTPQIANFSNWGPADDRRIKPDISAAGVDIYSTMAHLLSNPVDYDEMSGTSMACPSVTGALALIQQHYGQLHTTQDDMLAGVRNYMLSSTLRGLMAHCATEAGPVGPDPKFGWGVINAEKMAEVVTEENNGSLLLENVLAAGQEYELEVEATGTESLVVTLAWTDPAPNISEGDINNQWGESIAVAIVNDLDVKVVKGSEENFPWKLPASNTAAALKGVNNVDNIEKVEVDNPSGTYTIKISHKGATLVNPADTSQPQQVYSLIVTGIGATTDVKDLSKSSFSVWPNPAHGRLNISIPVAVENGAKAVVYDMQGRVVLQNAISTADTELNIENLSSGVYFVNLTNGNKNEVKRFIVK